MIIGTPVPHNAQVPMGFLKSMLGVTKYTHVMQEGPSIPENRNAIFETARIYNEDLLFIDSDMMFTPKDVEKMENHLKDKDIVCGLYVMSYPGFPPSLFDTKGKLVFPKDESIFEIGSCGAGFIGISKKVIHTLIEPFSLLENKETGRFNGEDISFCIRARDAGFKLLCDPSMKIGHIRTQPIYYGQTKH